MQEAENLLKPMPELVPLKMGSDYKIFQINGKKGMEMPSHHSTKEAVVCIQEGSAILRMNGEDFNLNKEDVFIIPAGKTHSLELTNDFKAVAIMATDSEIQFEK